VGGCARNYSLDKAAAAGGKCGPLTAAFANFVLHNSLFCIAPTPRFYFASCAAQHNTKNKFDRVKILLFESCCFCAAARETILLSVRRKVNCRKTLLQKQKKEWKMPLSSPFTQRTMEMLEMSLFFFCVY
jgi:hypothetical protein